MSVIGSSWNLVSGYIKNVDTHHESVSSNKQVMKKLSPKSLWQTYMKWTVVGYLFKTVAIHMRPHKTWGWIYDPYCLMHRVLFLHIYLCGNLHAKSPIRKTINFSHFGRENSIHCLLILLAAMLRPAFFYFSVYGRACPNFWEIWIKIKVKISNFILFFPPV